MIYFNTVALLLTLSSWLTSPALAQEGGILQPVLPSDIRQCSNITVSWSETEPPAGRSQIYAVRLVNSSTAGLELAAEVPITWLGHFSEGETSHNW